MLGVRRNDIVEDLVFLRSAIVLVAVFTEAEENRVDRHLERVEEDLGDDEGDDRDEEAFLRQRSEGGVGGETGRISGESKRDSRKGNIYRER